METERVPAASPNEGTEAVSTLKDMLDQIRHARKITYEDPPTNFDVYLNALTILIDEKKTDEVKNEALKALSQAYSKSETPIDQIARNVVTALIALLEDEMEQEKINALTQAIKTLLQAHKEAMDGFLQENTPPVLVAATNASAMATIDPTKAE